MTELVLRRPETAEDFDRWAAIKSRVVPDDPVTGEQIERATTPDRLALLAERAGRGVGCGGVTRFAISGLAAVSVRVLPESRRSGVGSALFGVLAEHARTFGADGPVGYVAGDDRESAAWAKRRGFVEVDSQLEQVRIVTPDETPAPVLAGVAIVPVTGELLRAAYDAVAVEGYADMALVRMGEVQLEHWLTAEATRPEGTFVALDGDEIVGYAGMREHANGSATAEHGLTTVSRDRRRLGIATALKRTQLAWAARSGVHELVTWTQRGNEGMQALNRKLGYVDRAQTLTLQGPLL